MSGRTGRRDPTPWRRHLLRLALLGSVFAVPALAEESGIAIAIDGAALDGTPAPAVEPDADIKMTFDGLNVQPRLNVATADLRRTYRAGETVRFSTSSNYPAFIAGAEIRILAFDGKAHGTAPVAVLPVEPNGMAEWVMPDDGPAEFVYVLRVRDAEGHHDETAPLALARGDHEGHATTEPVVAAGEGEDRAARRDIPVFGGAVTVSGRGIAAGDIVTVAGETIPVDGDGRFVTQRILPPGDHRIDVAVAGERTMTASRDIAIPTIGIGASAACDGQILVMEDMLGLSPRVPKFVREFGEVGKAIEKAIASYADEVRARSFPTADNTYQMKD